MNGVKSTMSQRGYFLYLIIFCTSSLINTNILLCILCSTVVNYYQIIISEEKDLNAGTIALYEIQNYVFINNRFLEILIIKNCILYNHTIIINNN